MGSAVRFACLCGKWASIDAVKSGLSELGFPAAPADREEAAEYCVAFIAEVDPTLIEYVEELSKTLQVIVVLIPSGGRRNRYHEVADRDLGRLQRSSHSAANRRH